MSAHRSGTGHLPPHARSGLAAAIEAAAGPNVLVGSNPSVGPVAPATHLESAVADVPATVVDRGPESRLVMPVAPGGDVEPWAVLESSEVESVQMELVISNPDAEPSALDGVRDALRDMHREGVAGSPTNPDDPSARPDRRSAPASAHELDDDHDFGGVSRAPTAAPSTAEGLLRSAIVAGRKAAVQDARASEVETPPQPDAAQAANHATDATPTSDAVEELATALGMVGDPTPGDLPPEEPPRPAVDVADDFGPLSSEPSDTGRRRLPPSRWLLGGAAILVTSLLVGVGFALAGDHEAAGQTAETASNPGSPAQAAAPEVTWRTWRGMQLPVSVHSGPTSWSADGDHVSGFARTPLGAAIAAAHLSVRVDPAAGEAAWRAVLKDQAVGDSSRLEAALAAATTSPSKDAGEPGVLTGWRVSGDPATGKVVAHLAVDTGERTQDFGIPLAWHDGDWALNIPDPSEPIFTVTDTDGHFAPFQGEQ